MFVPHWKRILLLLIIIGLSSCFGGVDNRGSVRRYQNGLVETEGGSFRVGLLPASWVKTSFKYRAILFQHQSLKASISVDSFCKGAFSDAPLNILSNQLVYGMTQENRKFQKIINIDGREAMRSLTVGKMDGVQVALDTVVLKMNQCVFDFVYIADPYQYPRGRDDFETFYNGFHYVTGPEVDE